MIRQEIDIDGWWRLTVFYAPGDSDVREVTDAYRGLGCPESDIDTIRTDILPRLNKGSTFTSGYLRHSVTVIGRASSWDQFFDTVLHEVKHIVDDIVSWYGIMNYGEPPAYLQGEIGRMMAPAIRRIACPCCGTEKETPNPILS